MGKFDGITLISDIDGTLFSSPGTIPQANVEAAEYFMANGGRFAVATGRSQVSIAKNFDKFRVNTPCIVLNGTGLYDYSLGGFILKRICNDRLGLFFRLHNVRYAREDPGDNQGEYQLRKHIGAVICNRPCKRRVALSRKRAEE